MIFLNDAALAFAKGRESHRIETGNQLDDIPSST